MSELNNQELKNQGEATKKQIKALLDEALQYNNGELPEKLKPVAALFSIIEQMEILVKEKKQDHGSIDLRKEATRIKQQEDAEALNDRKLARIAQLQNSLRNKIIYLNNMFFELKVVTGVEFMETFVPPFILVRTILHKINAINSDVLENYTVEKYEAEINKLNKIKDKVASITLDLQTFYAESKTIKDNKILSVDIILEGLEEQVGVDETMIEEVNVNYKSTILSKVAPELMKGANYNVYNIIK